jgi:hypothetical protein
MIFAFRQGRNKSFLENNFKNRLCSMKFRSSFISATFLLALFCSTANAAPVTFNWVNTTPITLTKSFTWEPDPPGPPVTRTVNLNASRMSASVTIGDESLLSGPTFTAFAKVLPFNPNLPSTLQGSATVANYPMQPDFYSLGSPNLTVTIQNGYYCPTAVFLGGPCQIDVNFTKDLSDPTKYYGSLSFFQTTGSSVEYGSLNLIANGVGSVSRTLATGGRTSQFLPALPATGYWQVASASNVPLPSSVLLIFVGIVGAVLSRRRMS